MSRTGRFKGLQVAGDPKRRVTSWVASEGGKSTSMSRTGRFKGLQVAGDP